MPGTGRWRRLEHTADLRVEFSAPDLAGLFAAGADCLFDTMLDRAAVRPVERRAVSLRSASLPELFLDFLRELLFRYESGFAVATVARLAVSPETNSLEAELAGEETDPSRHGLKLEIKSPTYHGYLFEPVPGGWRAVVLFDL
ncbi:MAG: archease [bacterium]